MPRVRRRSVLVVALAAALALATACLHGLQHRARLEGREEGEGAISGYTVVRGRISRSARATPRTSTAWRSRSSRLGDHR